MAGHQVDVGGWLVGILSAAVCRALVDVPRDS